MSTFCALPWNHLATHPHGEVSLCCRVDFYDNRGMAYDLKDDGDRYFNNLNVDKIEKVINSDSFRDTRLKMLRGEKPLACMGCYRDEELNLISKRQRENKIFGFTLEDLRKKTALDGSISVNLEYAELRLGNLCNLKCRSCNPNSSSKWHAEYSKLKDSLDFIRSYDLNANFGWSEDETFWEDFFQHAGPLRQLYINGGEPTLIKQHWRFLEKLIESGLSRNIDIKYNINMTYLPANAFKIWSEFKHVFVGASIDDLKERNAYIRHGSKWSEIVKNLNQIRDAGFGVAVEQTVSVYNVYYLDEMELFCKNEKIGYGLNFVNDPDYLSLRCLPDVVKKRIFNKLSKRLSKYLLDEVMAHLSEGSDLLLWEKFRKFSKYLDETRNEKFVKVFPEFSDLLTSEGFIY